MLTYVKKTKKYGRGVYAAQDIKTGTVIEVCHVLKLSQKDTRALARTDLKWYVFKYNKKQDCIVLGNGELYNHSDDNNTEYHLSTKSQKMYFIAIRDIKKNEQLFTNYNQDVKVDTKKGYKVNL